MRKLERLTALQRGTIVGHAGCVEIIERFGKCAIEHNFSQLVTLLMKR